MNSAARLFGSPTGDAKRYHQTYHSENVRKTLETPAGMRAHGTEPMQLIEKGVPGPGLLAHVAVSKICRSHLPL
jgi:transposase